MKAVPVELKAKVLEYADRRNGQLYAPILHPDLIHIPVHHGPERFQLLKLHIPVDAKTAIDIGSHWGYFCHEFVDAGLEATAVENSAEYLYFLNGIRDACERDFAVYEGSIFDLEQVRFDVVNALNIFHHFIKTEVLHEQLKAFLRRVECSVMFFQPHNTREGQMKGAFRNYSPTEFCDFIIANSSLSTVEKIGTYQNREIFKLLP